MAHKIDENIKNILDNLPTKPGCYVMKNKDDDVIYVGKAINPLGLQGQVEGGVVMGLGHALMEEFVVREGKVISDRMAKYQIPHIHADG